MTPPIQTKSVIRASSEFLAAVGVGDRHQEEADGGRDEDQVNHGVASDARGSAAAFDGRSCWDAAQTMKEAARRKLSSARIRVP